MYSFDGGSGWWTPLVTVVLGILLVSTVGTTVTARPPPHAVCGVCTEALASAAAEEGIAIGVAGSSLVISIDRSGTGHWTARVQLTGSDVETLTENPSLRQRVVERVYERSYVAVEDPGSLTTSMNGSTLIVEYVVPGMAHESTGGVYVVDFFYWHDGEARWFYLAADSMTMRGPAGTVVSHAPADATTDGSTVIWEGPAQPYDSRFVGRHVVFAPDTGIVTGAATALGIGVDVAQLKAQDIAAAGAPVAVLAVVIALLLRVGTRLATLRWAHLVGIVVGPLIAVGIVAAAIETLVGVSGPLTAQFGDLVFYLSYTLTMTGAGPAVVFGVPLVVGQVLLAGRLLASNPGPAGSSSAETGPDAVVRLLVWPTAVILGGQWFLFPLAVAGGYDTLYGLVSLVLPALYFVPLAITCRRRNPLRLAFTAGLVLAAIPVVFAIAPHTRSLVVDSLAMHYVPWVLIVAAVGTLAYARGYRLVANEDEGGCQRVRSSLRTVR